MSMQELNQFWERAWVHNANGLFFTLKALHYYQLIMTNPLKTFLERTHG